MKVVPAGISKKTGKSYNAFYSCWGCKGTAKMEQQPYQSDTNDETIEKIRLWARGAQAKMNTLEQRITILEKDIKEISNLKTLMYELAGNPATDFHSSMSGKTVEQIEEDLGGEIVKGLDGNIPIITE